MLFSGIIINHPRSLQSPSNQVGGGGDIGCAPVVMPVTGEALRRIERIDEMWTLVSSIFHRFSARESLQSV